MVNLPPSRLVLLPLFIGSSRFTSMLAECRMRSCLRSLVPDPALLLLLLPSGGDGVLLLSARPMPSSLIGDVPPDEESGGEPRAALMNMLWRWERTLAGGAGAGRGAMYLSFGGSGPHVRMRGGRGFASSSRPDMSCVILLSFISWA